MFNFKSQLLGAAALLPIAAASLLGSAGSAQAAALTGSFSFAGGTVANPFANSTVTLKTNSLTFAPQPITPVSVGPATGSFTAFNSADINSITSFGVSNTSPFLDLGYLTLPGLPTVQTPGLVIPGADISSITDNKNTFNLTNSFYTLKQLGSVVTVDVHLLGKFLSETGETSNGEGSLTFQTDYATTVADVQTLLGTTGLIGASGQGLTFSGAAFTATVPEPTTMVGLGLVAAGMTFASRRKAVKA